MSFLMSLYDKPGEIFARLKWIINGFTLINADRTLVRSLHPVFGRVLHRYEHETRPDEERRLPSQLELVGKSQVTVS